MMSATNESIERAIAPLVAARNLCLYDIELSGSGRARVLRVTVTDAEGRGPDIDQLASLTREIDPVVEAAVDGGFSLEVSSPGLERSLRRPEHFATARGQRVALKARGDDGASTRLVGTLTSADATSIEVLDDDGAMVTLDLDAITSARTLFEWGPAPRPGKGSKPGSAKQHAAKTSTTGRT